MSDQLFSINLNALVSRSVQLPSLLVKTGRILVFRSTSPQHQQLHPDTKIMKTGQKIEGYLTLQHHHKRKAHYILKRTMVTGTDTCTWIASSFVLLLPLLLLWLFLFSCSGLLTFAVLVLLGTQFGPSLARRKLAKMS